MEVRSPHGHSFLPLLTSNDHGLPCDYSRRWTPVKCAYLFSRYFGIALQLSVPSSFPPKLQSLELHVSSNYIFFRTKISCIPVSSEICSRWYAFQIAIFWSLFTSYDVVTMLRGMLIRRSAALGLTFSEQCTLFICSHLGSEHVWSHCTCVKPYSQAMLRGAF